MWSHSTGCRGGGTPTLLTTSSFSLSPAATQSCLDVIFTPSQFRDTGPFSSTNIPLLLSTGPSIPKALSPPWSCLFVLQECFWVFSPVKHVNTIISRAVVTKNSKGCNQLQTLRVLIVIPHCQFKMKTDSRLQIVNDDKVRWRVEWVSLEIRKYWNFLKASSKWTVPWFFSWLWL